MNIVERTRKSVEAHKQNWLSKHYELSADGKKIRNLKNIHAGEKCFIIGNGPSLTSADLQLLHEKNICTFASNRIYQIFDKTDWRPTYYASEDIIILRDIEKEVEKIPAQYRFIPVNLKWYESINVANALHFFMDYDSEIVASYGLSLDPAHGIRCKGTVTITCIQMAIYMGFSEIYLLGVDHNYAKIIDENGNVVEDNSVKNYFSDKYDADIKDMLTHDIGSATRAFMDVEMLSRQMKTFKVYNATRGGKLEVFERADFDRIVK